MEAGMDGALTGVDESEVGEQQLTPCELLNCRLGTVNAKPVKRDGGHAIDRRKRRTIVHVGNIFDGDHRQRRLLKISWTLPPNSVVAIGAPCRAAEHDGHESEHFFDAPVGCCTNRRARQPFLG